MTNEQYLNNEVKDIEYEVKTTNNKLVTVKLKNTLERVLLFTVVSKKHSNLDNQIQNLINNINLDNINDRYLNFLAGVKENNFDYFKKSADAGWIYSAFNMGNNPELDINSRIKYYEIAASQLHREAIARMGYIYYYDEDIALYDQDKALHWYRLYARLSDQNIRYKLGNIYENGLYGTSKNIYNAISIYSEEVDIGYCFYDLAYIYENTKEIIDKTDVITYYEQADQNGYTAASYRLGEIYEDQNDIDNAIRYYEQADQNGYTDASYKLGQIYEDQHDIDNSIIYYTKASSKIADASYKLGKFYECQKYGKVNIKLAVHYYNIAANKKHIKSIKQLIDIYKNGRKGIHPNRFREEILYYKNLLKN